MEQEATPQRRAVVLGGVAVVAGGGVLAACSSGESSGGSAGAGSGAGSGDVIVKLADVPVGGAVAAQAPSGAVIVAQPAAGQVVAFSAVCTHQGCTVAPAGATLDCPCHGSKYDALTGKVLNGPAPADLPRVPVKVSGQDVVAG